MDWWDLDRDWSAIVDFKCVGVCWVEVPCSRWGDVNWVNVGCIHSIRVKRESSWAKSW